MAIEEHRRREFDPAAVDAVLSKPFRIREFCAGGRPAAAVIPKIQRGVVTAGLVPIGAKLKNFLPSPSPREKGVRVNFLDG